MLDFKFVDGDLDYLLVFGEFITLVSEVSDHQVLGVDLFLPVLQHGDPAGLYCVGIGVAMEPACFVVFTLGMGLVSKPIGEKIAG